MIGQEQSQEKYEDKIVLVSNNTSTWLNEINEKYLANGWNVMQIGSTAAAGSSSTFGCFVWIRRKI